jgi:hypothetical protein
MQIGEFNRKLSGRKRRPPREKLQGGGASSGVIIRGHPFRVGRRRDGGGEFMD